MNTLGKYITSQNLLKIKKIIDKDINGDKFTIVKTKKNIEFMREYSLNIEDIKNIIRGLSIKDCFKDPEKDRDSRYNGLLFFFYPMFEGIKLYIKIRIDNHERTICISIHEFGKYDEVEKI